MIVLTVEIPAVTIAILFYAACIWLSLWIGWKLSLAFLYGHCIEVGPQQYPQVYSVIKQASEALDIAIPRVLIMQGHGLFEVFVAKQFSKRGNIFITSNLMDEFADKPTSRAFMMYIGRQLGHIKAGHFKYSFFTNYVGLVTVWIYFAWKRRCHITADRIGLLCAGRLYDAEQALLMITVGKGLAPGTSYDALAEQAQANRDSFWSWLRVRFSTFPYMVDRIVALRAYASSLGLAAEMQGSLPTIGALPITHYSLRALPLLVIHGHDRVALLELQNLLYSKFPQVAPRVMMFEQHGTLGMSEKFERVSGDLAGAIALLTPDDKGGPAAGEADTERVRQNVILEIGWVWGRLGREKCLLLQRGNVELPSDLAGVDVEQFISSPSECVLTLLTFIENLISKQSARTQHALAP